MNWKQRALCQLMSDISEDCWCAGWMHGNEYALWMIVSEPSESRLYGRENVSDTDISDLREISAEIGGWIRWRDDHEDANLPSEEWGPVFTPMADWLQMYERHMAKRQELAQLFEQPKADHA